MADNFDDVTETYEPKGFAVINEAEPHELERMGIMLIQRCSPEQRVYLLQQLIGQLLTAPKVTTEGATL